MVDPKKNFNSATCRGIFVRLILVGMYFLVLLLAIRYFTGLGPDLEQLLSPNPPLFGQILIRPNVSPDCIRFPDSDPGIFIADQSRTG